MDSIMASMDSMAWLSIDIHGIHKYPWTSVDIHSFRNGISIDSHGIHGYPEMPMNICDFVYFKESMDFHAFQRKPWISRASMISWISMIRDHFHGYPWISMDGSDHGCPWM